MTSEQTQAPQHTASTIESQSEARATASSSRKPDTNVLGATLPVEKLNEICQLIIAAGVPEQISADSLSSDNFSARKGNINAPEIASPGSVTAPAKSHRKAGVPLPQETLSLETFIRQLLRRAPLELIEQESPVELAALLETLWRRCCSYLTDPDNIERVFVEPIAGRPALTVILNDSQFIVGSVSEVINSLKLVVSRYLHPIFVLGNRQISFSYIELVEATHSQLTELENSIQATLSDVALVTRHFPPLLLKLDKVAMTLNQRATEDVTVAWREVGEFLTWLVHGAFIFLGVIEREYQDDGSLRSVPLSALGLPSGTTKDAEKLLVETIQDAQAALREGKHFDITRLSVRGRVLRHLPLLCLTLITPESVYSIVGIFSNRGELDDAHEVPIIRSKVREVISRSDVLENSYDHSYIVETMDRMPKEILLDFDIDTLVRFVECAIGIYHSSEVHLIHRIDPEFRGIWLLAVVGRDRFSRDLKDKIQTFLEQLFDAARGSSEYYLDFSLHPHTKLYFYIPFQDSAHGRDLFSSYDRSRVQSALSKMSRLWREDLAEKLADFEDTNKLTPGSIHRLFQQAFPPDYEAVRSVDQALDDVSAVMSLSKSKPISTRIEPVYDRATGIADPTMATVVLYRLDEEIAMSRSLPVLEHAGLEVTTTDSYRLTLGDGRLVFMHLLTTRAREATLLLNKDSHSLVQHINTESFRCGISQILSGIAEDDILNTLLTSAGLTISDIRLLRAYSCLLWQVDKSATRGAIFHAVAETESCAKLILKIFKAKFDPDLLIDESTPDLDSRRHVVTELVNLYHEELDKIAEISRDRILRSLLQLLEHTVRTNAFLNSNALVFKLASEQIDIMPEPRPLFEIYVRSSSFEGVHLRGARVARGGIRWSERNDDFRSEVLGLMKTQKLKNVLIVPGGAKGGFVVRYLPKNPAEVGPVVEQAYREFIRGLLSVTDNRIGDSIVTPARVVRHDPPDPYLVVAADKGTATFSDIANSIAIDEFNFWLGDAFASGGSQGYDHKKYGITAKGTWECVRRHFHDIGLNYERTSFTLVGIGDMSGDVFGNGLLLSRKMKLIGAFNHKHVFVDPDPDPDTSFIERERLFNLPRSQWSDYRADLISKGGGVFGRYDKEIVITEEMRSCFHLPSTVGRTLTGEELISYILRAPCDLLWNGGIGTYVKASDESHGQVRDGTNDRVRVNANELRAKVVGEGGNLGFTQRARNEFALRGGRVNSDATDNSGGVDLSDHEVNIKILCSQMIAKGLLTRAQRDELLVAMGPEVVQHVLSHNQSHALSLSLGEVRSAATIGFYQSLLRTLAKAGLVHRELDALPDDADLDERIRDRRGLVRPELSICLAGVKTWIKSSIIHSQLLNDPLLQDPLLEYFPQYLRERFPSEVVAHPLAREIIATQITNKIVDAVGITFIHRMCLSYGIEIPTVVKAILAANHMLHADNLRQSVSQFDNPEQNSIFLDLRHRIGKSLRDAAAWILGSHGESLALSAILDIYQVDLVSIPDYIGDVLRPDEEKLYQDQKDGLISLGVPEPLAATISLLPFAVSFFELAWVAHRCDASLSKVAGIHKTIEDTLGISILLKGGDLGESGSKWDQQLAVAGFQNVKQAVATLVQRCLARNALTDEQILLFLKIGAGYEKLISLIAEASSPPVPVSALAIVGEKMRDFSQGL